MAGDRLRISSQQRRLAAGLLLIVITSSFIPAGSAEEHDFLAMLVGKWRGRAVQTPIGPSSYDIHFEWIDENCIAGIADNEFSNHTWTFCDKSEELTLAFLSDFRGNQQPIHMQVISREDGKLMFHADSHPFMDVLVFPMKRKVRVDVMHHNRLHVRIEWLRHPC